MIRSFKLFTNTFQRILVSSFFLLQLLISVLEFLFLSMIPTMVIYMTNPDVAESNIRNFQNYISQNYFELNIDISIYTYIFILIFGLLLKNILSILNTFLEGGTIRIINYFNIQKIYSYYLNQPLEQIVANRNSEFIRDIISESSKAVGHLFNYLLID